MQFHNIIDKNATVIDVRESWEFEFGNAPGSINIPLGQIPNNLNLLEQMTKPLILICASGNRSGQATNYLKSQGFEAVCNGGGWREWQARFKKAA